MAPRTVLNNSLLHCNVVKKMCFRKKVILWYVLFRGRIKQGGPPKVSVNVNGGEVFKTTSKKRVVIYEQPLIAYTLIFTLSAPRPIQSISLNVHQFMYVSVFCAISQDPKINFWLNLPTHAPPICHPPIYIAQLCQQIIKFNGILSCLMNILLKFQLHRSFNMTWEKFIDISGKASAKYLTIHFLKTSYTAS